jgi:hypothetical protein
LKITSTLVYPETGQFVKPRQPSVLVSHSRASVSGPFVAFAVAGSDNIRYNGHDRETHRQTAALVGLVQAGSTTVLAVIRMAA